MKKETLVLEAGTAGMAKAAEIIHAGGIVVFPTETVYGLGADAFNEAAVRSIFEAKGRPADNPLIVHISDMSMLSLVAMDIPGIFLPLAYRFWPGPLTMILKKKPELPAIVTAGLDTVAVRMPSYGTALAFISACGTPICAPSANISGKPSATTAEHALDDFKGRVDAVIKGESSEFGLESTVLDISGDEPVILRPGSVTAEAIEAVTGIVLKHLKPHGDDAPRSPGMKYRHYAPAAGMTLYAGDKDKVREMMLAEADRLSSECKVGILCYEPCEGFERYFCRSLTQRGSAEEASRNLYSALRAFDKAGTGYILAESPPLKEAGAALMNRLLKACDNNIKYL